MESAELLAALGVWDRNVTSAEPLRGGWNSATWLVRSASGSRYVAKLADGHDSGAFHGGLRVAALAAARGFRSGPPVPRPDGALTRSLPEGELALLERVEGCHPTASSGADMRRAGAALARAHASLDGALGCLETRFVWPWQWADDCLDDIPMPPKVREAAAQVLGDGRNLVAEADLPVRIVHGDPGCDAFLLHRDAPERDGLIDWSATMGAPALYDVGSVAVLTLDTPEALRNCVRGYLDVVPNFAGQLRYLETFIRLRWMCQAIYFADRIARGIVRAGSDAVNRQALSRAYAGMTGSG